MLIGCSGSQPTPDAGPLIGFGGGQGGFTGQGGGAVAGGSAAGGSAVGGGEATGCRAGTTCIDASGTGDFACVDPSTSSGLPPDAPSCATEACPTGSSCWTSDGESFCLQDCTLSSGQGGGAVGGGTAAGGGTTSSGGSLFPDSIASGATNGDEPQLALDGTGRTHLLYTGRSPTVGAAYPVRYGECESGCDQQQSWSFITIADHGLLGSSARMAVDAAGHVRVSFGFSTAQQSNTQVMLASCDANCTQVSSWQAGEINTISSGSYLVGDGPNLALAASGMLMIAYLGNSTPTYGECSSNCTVASNWSWAQFGVGELQPVLQATPSGHPRILFHDRVQRLIGYLECDASCTQSGNWSAPVTPYYLGSSRYALALDAQGRPRIAWNQGSTGVAGQAAFDQKVYYAWCDASCASVTNWQAFDVALAANLGKESLALVLDETNGAPLLAYDESPSPTGLSLRACISGCNTPAASWSSINVETDAQLTASTPLPALSCGAGTMGVSYWVPGSQAALVINRRHAAIELVSRVLTLDKCGSNTYRDGSHLTRFASVPL